MPALVQLNAVTSPIFTGIGRSPVPVLLPFDTAAFLDARLNGAPPSLSLSRYQADFRPVDLFDAGPAGYDAVFSLEPGAGDGMPQRTFARPVEVQITGSILIYDISDPHGGKGEPVKALAAQFPDLRRFIREGYVRYAFTRFGVPYVVSIQCLDSTPRARRLACREAYPVAERFLKALRVAGGLPSRPRMDMPSGVAERPAATLARFHLSPDRRHHRQHRLSQAERPRRLHRLFADPLSAGEGPGLRPLAIIPAQAATNRRSAAQCRLSLAGQFLRGPQFRRRPMRQRFRPSGPGYPRRRMSAAAAKAANRCDPKQQAVVAVRDGVVIRSPKQQAATLQVNSRTEHIRFRYMHMNPASLDADGILNGRRVAEGEKIGVVSNYLDRPNGTSRHLHFDVQVFTRDGWLWVNPYVTLISAYERLIRGRGREIGPEPPAAPAVAHALPEDAAPSRHAGRRRELIVTRPPPAAAWLPRRRGPAIGGAEPVPDIDRGDRRGEIGQLLLGKFRARLRIDLVADAAGQQGQRFGPRQRGALARRKQRRLAPDHDEVELVGGHAEASRPAGCDTARRRRSR